MSSTPPVFSALASNPVAAPGAANRPPQVADEPTAPPPQESVEVSQSSRASQAEELLDKALVVDAEQLADAQFVNDLKAAVAAGGPLMLMVVPHAEEAAAPHPSQPAVAEPPPAARQEPPVTLQQDQPTVPAQTPDPRKPPDKPSPLAEALAAKNLLFDPRQPITVRMNDGVAVSSGEHATQVGFGIRFQVGGPNGAWYEPAKDPSHLQRVDRELYTTSDTDANSIFYYRPTRPGVQLLRFNAQDGSTVTVPVVVQGSST